MAGLLDDVIVINARCHLGSRHRRARACGHSVEMIVQDLLRRMVSYTISRNRNCYFVITQSHVSIAGGVSRAWTGHEATAARGARGDVLCQDECRTRLIGPWRISCVDV